MAEGSLYVTGWCSSGGHAGKRISYASGALIPQCPGIKEYSNIREIVCGCWCHAMFAEFAVTPSEVPISVLPGPSLQGLTKRNAGHDVNFFTEALRDPQLEVQVRQMIYKLILKQPFPRDLLTPAPRSDGGRRVAGSLDVNVEAVCRMYVANALPYDTLRPQDIALLVDAIDQPSNGAIHAVLVRWENQNLCELSDNPVSFVKFTDRVPSGGIKYIQDADRRTQEQRAKGFVTT